MNHSLKLALALGLALSAQACLQAADHGHLNAGVVGTKQNDKLIFDNAANFVSSSGYVKTLTYTNGGTYAGYFQGNITLTALPQTPGNAGPVANAPALGSYIQAELASVEGPPGGAFALWDTGATNPTFSLLTGQTGTNLLRLTESDGSPGTDPYGHIHGRRMTLTKPGIYKVGFKLFDTSTNGAGGGPIHTPSDELFVWFQAGVNIESVEPDYEGGHVHVRFGAAAGYSWQMEATKFLGPQADWQPAGNPFTGNDYLIELIHEGPPADQRFYRLNGTPVAP